MKQLPLLLAALAVVACSQPPARASADEPARPEARPPHPSALYAHVQRTVPAAREIGWAVLDLETGARAGQNQTQAYPMQSVFKLWLAAYVLDAAERGAIRLDETILVTREDLGFPYQPIARKVDADGYPATVEELVRYIVIESDNPSADILLERIGGPAVLTTWLREKGVEGVRVDNNERGMHDLAGSMHAAKGEARKALIDAFIAGERDSATPGGTVDALARLHRGALLSTEATRRLLAIMAETTTGPKRIKAGLEPGWRWAHKTGSGGQVGGRSLGVNDVGLLTAPDGRTYAVAAFLAGSTLTTGEQEALMAEIARGVIAQWKADAAAPPS